MKVVPIDQERRDLIEAWRRHRRAVRRLAMELGGFEHVVEYLNGHLTIQDMADDVRAEGIDPREFVNACAIELGQPD